MSEQMSKEQHDAQIAFIKYLQASMNDFKVNYPEHLERAARKLADGFDDIFPIRHWPNEAFDCDNKNEMAEWLMAGAPTSTDGGSS